MKHTNVNSPGLIKARGGATLRAAAIGLAVLVMLGTSSRADMYRPGALIPGGVPAAPTNVTLSLTPTTATLSWYGVEGWYDIQAETNYSLPWVTLATVPASSYAWSATVPLPDLTNNYGFRLYQSNYYAGSSSCSSCHNDHYAPWIWTAHASAFSLITNQSAQASTLPYVTVGYGQQTGFTNSSTTPLLENVGCENCHGPAGAHRYGDKQLFVPAVSIDPMICGGCHSGTYHPTYDEYSTSLHAQVNDTINYGVEGGVYYTNTVVAPVKGVPTTLYGYYLTTNSTGGLVTNATSGIFSSSHVPGSSVDSGDDRQTSCGVCHSGAARLAMIDDYEARLTGITNALVLPSAHDAGSWGPTCGLCHDPHQVNQFVSGYGIQYVTNIVSGITNKITNYVANIQALQLRNPTWSSNFFTMPSQSDKRYDNSGNPYYMNTTFASMYNPNINVCGQCHNTRGARWDGLAYGLLTNNVVSAFVTNVVAQEVYSNSYSYTTNQYGAIYTLTNVYDLGRIEVTNVLPNVTNAVVTVGLTTNVTGLSRAPHNSVQYNILIGILQPDYLNTTNGKTVYTNGVVNNGMGIYATHSGIVARNPVNTNQCATCHVPSYTTANGNVTGHTFQMDTHNCTICHSSGPPDWVDYQATTTNTIRNLVTLLNQWATDKGSNSLGVAAYNTSLQNSWEYTTPGALASVTNAGPSTANQLLLPAAILQARFDTYMVRNDGSLGVHNPTFIPILLSDAETKVLGQYPVAGFTAKTVIGAPQLKVVFSNLGVGLTSYSWNFGDGNTSTIANPTNTYANTGTYTVTFTGTTASGTETLVRSNYITVVNLPTAGFTANPPTGGTHPVTVNFSNTSANAAYYQWTFSLNSTNKLYSNAVNPSFTFTNASPAGYPTVILKAYNAGGSVSVTNNSIQVN